MGENLAPDENRRNYIFRSINRGNNSPCIIMGILNITPDSFHSESRRFELEDSVKRGIEIWDYGATWLDIGGESTRPGASPVDTEEELRRVIPVIKSLKERRPEGLISIDTRRAKVAREAINAGAEMINDISGFSDPEMIDVVLETGCAVCIMHMQGEPEKMQENPEYNNCVEEVSSFLFDKAQELVESGHPKELIIIDPGIGFGKLLSHNIQIIKSIETLTESNFSTLLGVSRKSMIGQITGKQKTEDRLPGTLATSAFAFYNKIDIIRVHDIDENVDLMKVLNELN
ncbi:MAG: dihydropteroate synthase [Candidatus Poseidoniaceae archaeon]|tara:strand:- start:4590 stop:5453 length:864 start_codon:yes stop_codon:yes gene_type:complete